MAALITSVRTRMRFRDINTGLCWSINGYWWGDINDSTFFAAADVFAQCYLWFCNQNVKLIDWSYSRLDVLGESVVVPAASFTVAEGHGVAKPVPMAECVMLTGKSNDTAFGIGRWQYKLHGIDTAYLGSSGEFTPGAEGDDLLAAAKNYLFAYRKTGGSRPYWTIIDPPAQAPDWELSVGFYVRRLGSGFYLPGQRARY